MPEIVQRRVVLPLGDRLVLGGVADAVPGDAAPTGVSAKVSVRTKDLELVRDLTAQGEVVVTPDGEGGFVVRASVAGVVTAGWPLGVLFADIEVTTDQDGPVTVERTEIRTMRSVTP